MHPMMLEQAAMYTAYHRDHRNVLTHVFGVPAIIIAIILALHRVDLGGVMPGLTLGWIVAIGFALFYIAMQPLAGALLAALLLIATWLCAGAAHWSNGAFWSLVALFFVGGWIVQLIGHAFEGRRPALTDNALQIFVAPLFLVLEAFFAAGQMQELRETIENRSHAYDPAG